MSPSPSFLLSHSQRERAVGSGYFSPGNHLAWGKTLDSGIPCHLVPWAVCLSNLGFLVEVDAAGRNPARCVYEPGHGKDPGRVGKEIDEQSPKL